MSSLVRAQWRARLAGSFEERLGQCYVLAGGYISGRFGEEGVWLVHGSIQGMGHPRIGHAWVAFEDGTVYDPVMDQTFDAYVHEQFFNAIEEVRYTPDEVRVEMLRQKHWGPWHTGEFGL